MENNLTVGSCATNSLLVSSAVVDTFAATSGDANPLHVDEAFAARTRFGRRIAQGMLGGALISSVIGNQLPGPGTIYLSQSLSFRAPVFIDDTITARVTVVECLEKRRYRLRTEVFRQDGQLVLEGEALVIAGHSEERR